MPKRKSYEEELDHLTRKIRKLQKKIRKSDSANSSSNEEQGLDMPSLIPSDWLLDDIEPTINVSENKIDTPTDTTELPHILEDSPNDPDVPNTSTDTQNSELPPELDSETLEILGEEPSTGEKYGKEIREELARRFEYLVTEGLPKESLKDVSTKYMIPANCKKINAPKINPEIKVAIPEAILKRDKGIEQKQKQMANAISCLGEVITMHLNSNEKNNEMLKKLMDLSRLLCERQHNDSVTRRNLIMFSLKKDLKEHITTTKIDSFLFSETLSETLKTAKTINKSAVELKQDSTNKNTDKTQKRPGRPLNYRAPAPAFRQSVQPRRNQPAVARAPSHPPPPAHSSRMSLRQLPPPPPPPPQRRRQY